VAKEADEEVQNFFSQMLVEDADFVLFA